MICTYLRKWVCGGSKYVDVTNNGTVRLEKMPRLIDAAYYMLCWCIQKGFVKTNKEVKDGRKEN